ncbi:hypothetical protein AK95_14695 [Paenibacillus sp. LC231]|uniref:hypothetical protein n=1 Tax=Paenibacillus sp. LC231 TaxID=1120679 RepID=UPI0008DE56EB|nr:hypothetical protein [Paenibacillus sp. LC231]OIB04861.1 hypothetical protein AK95_14695 [Paenibacillus sp. LC231]
MKITNKKYALTAALQAGAAHEFALIKSRRQFKREASGKTPYKPGSIGPSVVATAISKAFHGVILNRSERKRLAKIDGKPFQKFYAQG